MAQADAQKSAPAVTGQVAKTSRRRQFWQVAQLPVLAFVTALLVGGVIIALSDFTVLEELSQAFNSLSFIGWVMLAAAVVVLAGGIYLSRNSERVATRFLNRTLTVWQRRLFSIVTFVVGGVLSILLLRAAGFGPALEAAWVAVTTAYGALFEGSIGSPAQMVAALQSGDPTQIREAFYPLSESLVSTTPYIFAGLAVALGFRAGLFNIGVEGQLFIGAITSVWVGYTFKGLPWFLHLPLALAAGALGGAAWAYIPAILKVKFGAHEVINTIMMNYIAFRLSEWLLNGPMMRPGSVPVSSTIETSAELPRFFEDPIRFHGGFFLALAAAVFVWWLLFKTTRGFELRTVGANPNAARYAGMSIARNIVLTMCISGALAGLAGANEVLGVNHNLALAFSSGYGFDSIALALLGKNHPFGVVLAALLFGTLRSGGTRMQNVAKIPVDIIGVTQALVIAFIAAPAIIRAIYRVREERAMGEVFTRGWGR
jgi:simple sugar transport system permease protein